MKSMKSMKHMERTAEDICFVGLISTKQIFMGLEMEKMLHIRSFPSYFLNLFRQNICGSPKT